MQSTSTETLNRTGTVNISVAAGPLHSHSQKPTEMEPGSRRLLSDYCALFLESSKNAFSCGRDNSTPNRSSKTKKISLLRLGDKLGNLK